MRRPFCVMGPRTSARGELASRQQQRDFRQPNSHRHRARYAARGDQARAGRAGGARAAGTRREGLQHRAARRSLPRHPGVVRHRCRRRAGGDDRTAEPHRSDGSGVAGHAARAGRPSARLAPRARRHHHGIREHARRVLSENSGGACRSRPANRGYLFAVAGRGQSQPDHADCAPAFCAGRLQRRQSPARERRSGRYRGVGQYRHRRAEMAGPPARRGCGPAQPRPGDARCHRRAMPAGRERCADRSDHRAPP